MSEKTATSAAQDTLLPPEEKFWKRYSPHHELPLSATTSVLLHGLAFGILIALAYLALKLTTESNKPLPVDAIAIAPGGGGDPSGQGDGAGAPGKTEDVDKANPNPTGKTEPRETLKQANVDPLTLPEYQTPAGRLLDDAASQDALESLTKLSEATRKELFAGLGRSKGEGGTGTGGGKGDGVGAGEGDGIGSGKMTARQKRVVRWKLLFDRNEYQRQLAFFGAVIALPQPGGEYLVIRNLNQPQGKVEDLSKINLFFCVDPDPQSVAALTRALGVSPASHVVAFFPDTFEKELIRLEKAFRGKEENQVRETRFHVDKKGTNGYSLRVESQR